MASPPAIARNNSRETPATILSMLMAQGNCCDFSVAALEIIATHRQDGCAASTGTVRDVRR
jgi:hypothetical protein